MAAIAGPASSINCWKRPIPRWGKTTPSLVRVLRQLGFDLDIDAADNILQVGLAVIVLVCDPGAQLSQARAAGCQAVFRQPLVPQGIPRQREELLHRGGTVGALLPTNS